MKKNGYLRRFLALFLALVMIMADSSVTTFAATVGMVKQKSADAEVETENQQTVYTYEDSKVTVTATLENVDAVPDNAKFVVTKMNKADQQEDYTYAEQKLKEYEESENVLYDSYLIYDMHFEDENGNEIEPAEGQVSVNISYKKAQKLSDETTEDSVQVLHLDENLDQLEDVTDNVELNNKGKVEEVTLTTDSFSIFVIASQNRSEIEVEPMTDYSLYNILNNYNTFAKDSVKMGHSVGPVVAGGDYEGEYISGNGYVHKVDSYIKGKASIGGYNPHTNSTYMYLGKVNEWNYSGDQIRYTKNDDYIDFTKAFKSIESEMASVGKSVTNRIVNNNTLVAGESYNIHLNDYCHQEYGELTWKKGTDTASTDSVVYDDSNETVYLRAKADALGSAGAEYNPNGVGIVYLFPNAKKIIVSNWYQLMGHIVAPNADIEFQGRMNYAGCLVCKSLDTKGSESHMWPYNGSKIRPTSSGFEATKTVDGVTPTDKQKFEFTLSEYISGKWQEKETKENNGSSIVFNEIGYSSDSQLGDHWYLISEKQTPVNGYKLSGKQYLVKVTVTKTTSGSDTVYNKTEAYYEGPELPEIAVPNSSELKPLSSESAMVFDNETNNTETTKVEGTKTWDDADNQDGKRADSITVRLLADGKETESKTVTADDDWKYSFTDLPKYADGKEIVYTVTEDTVPDYTTKINGYNITNSYTPGKTSISVTKAWDDNDNQDGLRTKTIKVQLYAEGEKKGDEVTLTEAGGWTYTWSDLDAKKAGKAISYTVEEVGEVSGYTTVVTGDAETGFIITNTHTPETTKVEGTKTWNDANNQDGKRPDSITVRLLADGKEIKNKTVTAADGWKYCFDNLPKYEAGNEIVYAVTEDAVADYTTAISGYDITNSYTPGKTSITVTKAWTDNNNQDGLREAIQVQLYADGKPSGNEVTLSGENNWTYTWSNLEEKKAGKTIVYTVKESGVPEGYESVVSGDAETGFTITNSHTPETISISGTKTWDDADNQDGKRPESIIINLLANGEIAASQTVTADGAGNWTYTFTDLPKYANGEEITYTVIEEAVEGYETSVDGFNITNAYTTETTEVKGTKTWNDSDNQDGKRPESITVRLLANGEEKDSKTVTADENGNWTYSFENLPKYEAGKEIAYTVTEDAVADYTTEITGYDITNSYAPGKTSVTVTKAWADNNDRDGHRPKEIKVQLKADGENSGEEITLNAENKWTYTWSDLDQKKAGKDIVYTVEETSETTGYISEVTGDAAEGFVITNTITSVKISKVDITDQKELAGAHIQVIDKDGNVVDEWDSTWESHEVTGLKTGETYTLRETVAPDGYAVTADTTFVLKEDGTLDKDNTSTTIADDGRLLVEDSRTFVKVSKVDISDGEELEGAHIQIIDGDGNIVDEWDSTKEAHVTEKLKIGKTYTLRETVAPDGYLLTNDTTFVLKEDGTVDTEKTTTVSKDGVLLVQDSLATSASIAVTKRLTYVGENLVAKDQTFYVALYSDKECTKRVSDVKALEFKNSNASTVVFSENIKAGKTYYIAECTKDGISQVIGALADGTTYEAVFGDGNSTTVTEADGTTTVSFENVFSSFPPDGFYRQGQLTITKRVLGADGDTKNSDKVFYAGIFDDAAHTQLSQQVEQNIIELKMDGGYEVSEIINVGLAQPGTKVTLYVTETDSNGKPIAGSEDFGYKVSVSADSVTIDDTNMTAEVVITNQEEATETPTPTPSSDDGNGGGSEDHSSSYGGKSPKTGDDTPIGTYLMLLLAAAMLAAETERRRRRNKR